MKDNAPYTIIAIEIVVLGILVVGSMGLLIWQYTVAQINQRAAVIQTASALVSIPSITAPPPTGTATPTLVTPTATRTVTPTPDPRKFIAECTTIDAPGLYQLSSDITSATAGACIRIRSSQVTLDCAQHRIQGTAYNGMGIAIQKFGLLNDQMPSDVLVSNCRISKFKYGIYAESGRKLVIRGNHSSDNYDDTDRGTRYGAFLGMTEGGGIRLNYTSDSSILNNTTLHQAIGIDIRNSSNVRVYENISSDNSAWGINLIRTQNSVISNNITADNVRQCTWGAGDIGLGCDAGGIVLQDGSSNNLVQYNEVKGKNGNGIFIKAHAYPCGNDNSIIGNTVTGALYNSIELGFCTGNKINNNTFQDGLDAIWLGFAHNTEIKNNTILNMKNHGIISSNSHSNVISGNKIVNSNVGIYFFSEGYDRTFFSWLPPGDYRSHDNCLCSNIFQANTTAIHLKDSTNNQVTNNDFRGNVRGILLQGNTKDNDTQGNVN